MKPGAQWRSARPAWGWFAAAAGLAVGCGAQTAEPEGQAAPAAVQQRIEGGTVDTEHAGVFGVVSRISGGNSLCTATLIAPNLMLTARHCVAPTTVVEGVDCATDRFLDVIEPGSLKFSNATTPRWDDVWFDSASIWVDPGGDEACGRDIALVVLERTVPEQIATPIEPRVDALAVQEPYVAVGYGADNEDPAIARAGTRHSLEGLAVECLGQGCASDVAASEFGGSPGVCSGDSGGPALDQEGRVMGLLSRGVEGCGLPIYTRVGAFRPLLFQAASVAAEQGGYPLPVWAGGTPPAPSVTATASVPPDAPGSADAGAVSQETRGAGLQPEASCSLGAVGSKPHGSRLGMLLASVLAVLGFSRGFARRTRRATSPAGHALGAQRG